MEHHAQEKIELIKKSFEYKHQKKYKEAIEMLYKVLEYENGQEDNIEILSRLGDLYMLIGSYDRAHDQFQKILSINEKHEYSLQQCFEIYFRTNQLNKALKISSKMCEETKTTKSYHNYLRTLIALNKNQDAIAIFNTLDESIKMDSDILYLIATISEEKKPIILERIVEIDEAHISANIELATIEFDKGNYEKVISYCLNLIDDHPLALYYLARIEAHRQNHTRAVELYTKAINLDKDEHDFYIDLAKSYIDISWYDEALMALKKSINLSIAKNNGADLDERHFLTAWILIKQNQPQKALLNLNSIKENSALYSKAQILIQVINLKNANSADVVLKLEKYYQEEKDNTILLDTLALAYKELKMYKKAISIYKEALELYPNSIYYALEIIDLLIDDKNYDRALELIEKIKDNCKNCPSIYNSLTRIYYRLKQLDNALNSINEYLKIDNNNAESHYFKGLILNDLEKFEEAKNSIYTAIKINPTVAKYYAQMARSYKNLKEYENALLYIKEAIEIDGNELNYKKQAYEIALNLENKEQIQLYKKQLDRSKNILKFNR